MNALHHTKLVSGLYSQVLGGVLSHLNTSLRQVDANSQPFSHADIWVLGLLESFLQSLQLGNRERRAAAALLLLVPVSSFQDQFWRNRQNKR